MKQLGYLVILGFLLSTGCQTRAVKTEEDPQSLVASESEKANAFFEKAFQESLARSPMYQSYLGIKDQQDKWDDLSEQHAAENLEISNRQLAELKTTINIDLLDEQSLLSYKLFEKNAEDKINYYKWRYHSYPVNQMHGWQSQIPSFLINIHRISEIKDAEDYISRLNAIAELIPQVIHNLQTRVDKGIMPPRFVYPHVISDSENVITGMPFDESEKESTLLTDFKNKLANLDIEQFEKDKLIEQVRMALTAKVGPAYKDLITTLRSHQQLATKDDGVWKFPEGEAFYSAALRKTTTTDFCAIVGVRSL